MEKKILLLPELFISFFILIGLYFLLLGIFPINMEITPFSDRTEVQIHKRSAIPPFKNIDIVIPNVKQAVIGSSRSSKGGTTYRVELESYDGKKTPVTSYYSSGYTSKEALQKAINNAINNKTEYNRIIRQFGFLVFGFIFTVIPSIMLMGFITASKNTPKENTQVEYQKETQNYQATDSVSTHAEKDKYKNINDSIIK